MDPGLLLALARHGEVVATVRDFAARSGAERVVLVLDVGDPAGAGVLVEWTPDGEVELTEGGERHVIPAALAVPAHPRALPDVRAIPAGAMTIDAEHGELSAPLGAIAHLADAVLALARAFGGRTVASADFPTRDPEIPLTLAAREGEPPLVAVGEQRFQLPEGA